MRYEVIISTKAQKDLENIRNYIIEKFQDQFTADKIYFALQKKIQNLEIMPKRHKISGNPHSVRIKRYRIVYKVYTDKVLVVTIRHSSQNTPLLKSEYLK